MATQQELALQMIAQLRMLDPSVSADLGTPERKILDTVGQSLSDAQIDLESLRGALDLDSKFGDALDRFLALFGFARRKATFATGFVTFSRITESNNDIRIPLGTQTQAVIPSDTDFDGPDSAVFSTSFEVVLPAGELSVIAPVRANLGGTASNVPANTITQFIGNPVLGITSVTNVNPTQGGHDVETDDEFKVRFKNQIFRNLAGTKDQYLALAAATAFTTKANVIGPISRYREHIQVPPVADSFAYDVNADSFVEGGNGLAGEYTSALSDVPYSKYTYTEVPYFVASGIDATARFYRPDVDFRMNTTATTKNVGDTYREYQVTPAIGLNPTDPDATYQPNVTFLNVYTGTNPDIEAVRPGDVVLFEHSYLSSASRNDVENGVTNAVDVFIDGGNEVNASVITTRPDTTLALVDDPTSKFHYANYRRKGEPEHRPLPGNILVPLFWQPVTDLPDELIVNDVTYLKGIHYWVLEDTSELYGTIRARNGIEFSTGMRGIGDGDDDGDDASSWTGPYITAHPSGSALPVEDYFYDRNIPDLQATIESNKQITTDVLAHKARMRFFKFDVTIMYTPGTSKISVDDQVRQSVTNLLRANYFGQVIQLSDVLQAIHDVPGVDNVRWSTDVPGSSDLVRAYETDVNGNLLTNFILDRVRPGTADVSEKWRGYFTGNPESGEVVLDWNNEEVTVAFNANAASVQSALRTATGDSSLTVTGAGTPTSPFIIDWVTLGVVASTLVVEESTLSGGDKIYMTDFFLKDDELPALAQATVTGDTVAGLIIRQRAQNTFTTR